MYFSKINFKKYSDLWVDKNRVCLFLFLFKSKRLHIFIFFYVLKYPIFKWTLQTITVKTFNFKYMYKS